MPRSDLRPRILEENRTGINYSKNQKKKLRAGSIYAMEGKGVGVNGSRWTGILQGVEEERYKLWREQSREELIKERKTLNGVKILVQRRHFSDDP
jgi:hypothetical protein